MNKSLGVNITGDGNLENAWEIEAVQNIFAWPNADCLLAICSESITISSQNFNR